MMNSDFLNKKIIHTFPKQRKGDKNDKCELIQKKQRLSPRP